jgi:hypothetical protein
MKLRVLPNVLLKSLEMSVCCRLEPKVLAVAGQEFRHAIDGIDERRRSGDPDAAPPRMKCQ